MIWPLQSSASNSDENIEVDSNWIHQKLPPSLVMSMSMLKNGGFQMTTPTLAPIPPQPALNRNSLGNESSLDFKLATLRNEMVSNYENADKHYARQLIAAPKQNKKWSNRFVTFKKH